MTCIIFMYVSIWQTEQSAAVVTHEYLRLSTVTTYRSGRCYQMKCDVTDFIHRHIYIYIHEHCPDVMSLGWGISWIALLSPLFITGVHHTHSSVYAEIQEWWGVGGWGLRAGDTDVRQTATSLFSCATWVLHYYPLLHACCTLPHKSFAELLSSV